MPLRFAECADGAQILIYVLQTISSLQGIITSFMPLLQSWNIMVAQEKRAFCTFCQNESILKLKSALFFLFFFLRICFLFSINYSLPDIYSLS